MGKKKQQRIDQHNKEQRLVAGAVLFLGAALIDAINKPNKTTYTRAQKDGTAIDGPFQEYEEISSTPLKK